MKKIVITLLVIVTLLSIAVAMPIVTATPALHKVTATGKKTYPDHVQIFTLNAQQLDDQNTATGDISFKWIYSNGEIYWYRADVFILLVDSDTNTAYIGGQITDTNNPYMSGLPVYAAVQDGSPDKFNIMARPANEDIETMVLTKVFPPVFDISSGNIRVA